MAALGLWFNAHVSQASPTDGQMRPVARFGQAGSARRWAFFGKLQKIHIYISRCEIIQVANLRSRQVPGDCTVNFLTNRGVWEKCSVFLELTNCNDQYTAFLGSACFHC